jgi:hypothetical protein
MIKNHKFKNKNGGWHVREETISVISHPCVPKKKKKHITIQATRNQKIKKNEHQKSKMTKVENPLL